MKYINKDDLKKYISILSDDSLKGRAATSPENKIATEYIAKQFSSIGLKPFPTQSSYKYKKEINSFSTPEDYFQKFFILKSKLSSDNTLNLTTSIQESSTEIFFDYRKDFIVDQKSSQSERIKGSIVFVGYGVDDSVNKYSDYKLKGGKEINVKNKIVFFYDGTPEKESKQKNNDEKKSRIANTVKKKTEAAMKRGAVAVLVAPDPAKSTKSFLLDTESLYNVFSRNHYTLPELSRKESIPIVYISSEVSSELLSNESPIDSDEGENEISKIKYYPSELKGKQIELSLKYQNELIPSENVVGYLAGSDSLLKNEYIVVGAHFDHIGFGEYGSMDKDNLGKIHNGADDNASGTSGVLELAEAFVHSKPKRSVVFIAFNGEEMGMLGSRYYAYQNPMTDVTSTKAMVNLDMISRGDSNLVWAGGIFYSSDMKNVVETANKDFGMQILYNVGLFTFASDQGPFIRKKIPSVFFFAGMHDDYHTPADNVEKINADKAESVAKLAFLTAWELANTSVLPQYRELTMDEKILLVKESSDKQKKYSSPQIK